MPMPDRHAGYWLTEAGADVVAEGPLGRQVADEAMFISRTLEALEDMRTSGSMAEHLHDTEKT